MTLHPELRSEQGAASRRSLSGQTDEKSLGYTAGFASALLDPERPPPDVIAGPDGKSAVKRYNVYRNNVTVSLIAALAATFPATRRITGDDFFPAMARSHIRASPPQSPLLFEYGRGFPEFIEHYEYARSMPWLADVARIERAWLDCHHATDALPLPPEALASIAPEQLPEAVLAPHPAARILRSRFAAVSICAANRGGGEAGPIDSAGAEDALLTRPHMEVVLRRIPPGAAVFLSALMAGDPLGQAAAAALAETPAFDLSAAIASALEAGVFTAIRHGS